MLGASTLAKTMIELSSNVVADVRKRRSSWKWLDCPPDYLLGSLAYISA